MNEKTTEEQRAAKIQKEAQRRGAVARRIQNGLTEIKRKREGNQK